jgi:hypothetical protein
MAVLPMTMPPPCENMSPCPATITITLTRYSPTQRFLRFYPCPTFSPTTDVPDDKPSVPTNGKARFAVSLSEEQADGRYKSVYTPKRHVK